MTGILEILWSVTAREGIYSQERKAFIWSLKNSLQSIFMASIIEDYSPSLTKWLTSGIHPHRGTLNIFLKPLGIIRDINMNFLQDDYFLYLARGEREILILITSK